MAALPEAAAPVLPTLLAYALRVARTAARECARHACVHLPLCQPASHSNWLRRGCAEPGAGTRAPARLLLSSCEG
eukprot:COSAG01_NODE_44314_length_420_cov_1.052960_1_plen_74_part_10